MDWVSLTRPRPGTKDLENWIVFFTYWFWNQNQNQCSSSFGYDRARQKRTGLLRNLRTATAGVFFLSDAQSSRLKKPLVSSLLLWLKQNPVLACVWALLPFQPCRLRRFKLPVTTRTFFSCQESVDQICSCKPIRNQGTISSLLCDLCGPPRSEPISSLLQHTNTSLFRGGRSEDREDLGMREEGRFEILNFKI